MTVLNNAEVQAEVQDMTTTQLRMATNRIISCALQKFGKFLTMKNSSRLPTDAFASTPDDKVLLLTFLVHCRAVYAHTTVFQAILEPLNQYVSSPAFSDTA
jgi:hypothetical protein